MTLEEGLLALLAAAAAILLFLGLAQALDSRAPRGARRRHHPRASTPADDPRPSRWGPAVGRPAWDPSPPDAKAAPAVSDLDDGEAANTLAAADEAASPVNATGVAAGADPVWLQPATPPEPVVDVPDLVGVPPLEPAVAVPDSAPVPLTVGAAGDAVAGRLETCAMLLLAGKPAEVLVLAEPSLRQDAPVDTLRDSAVATGLWSVAALARRALGDEVKSQANLAAAVRLLPRPVLDGCPPRLGVVAVSIGRRLLEAAEQWPEGSDVRIMALRLAVFWLRWRLVAAPSDQTARAILETSGEAVSEAYVDAATSFIRSQQWSEAWRMIQQGQDRDELSLARAELLLGILASSLRHETERLTGPVIRGTKDERRALTALERAEAILNSMAEIPLPPRHRVAMARRVGRAYATLGMRRVKAGNVEPAAEALVRALGVNEIGGRAQRQVRDALIHALETMTDRSVETITALLADGNRAGAAEHVERLVARIERAKKAGLGEEDLAVASAKSKYLAEQVGSAGGP